MRRKSHSWAMAMAFVSLAAFVVQEADARGGRGGGGGRGGPQGPGQSGCHGNAPRNNEDQQETLYGSGQLASPDEYQRIGVRKAR